MGHYSGGVGWVREGVAQLSQGVVHILANVGPHLLAAPLEVWGTLPAPAELWDTPLRTMHTLSTYTAWYPRLVDVRKSWVGRVWRG